MPEIRIAEGFPGQRLIVVPSSIVDYAGRLPISRDLFPTHIGMFQSAKGHYINRKHGAPEHILIGCLAGSGKCKIRSHQWNLKSGNLIFLPANVRHEYSADEKTPWTIFWIHFNGKHAQEYLNALEISEEEPLINVSNMAGLIDTFEDIYQHTESGYTDTALLCLSTSFSRFLGVCRLYQRAVKASQRKTEDRVLESLKVMRESLHRKLSLDDLSAIAGWSPPHYSSVFKKQMNVSPMEFFARLKMQHACNQLKMTNDSIANIAASLGYEDSFYFSRTFRRHLDMAPSDYRNKFSLVKSSKFITE
jgi:AraC-like DNA-binding protein